MRSVTFMMLRWLTEDSRRRRLIAGRTTIEYGAYASVRWQDRDVPADYLPVDAGPDAPDGPRASMDRGYRAAALDGWLRLESPWVRVEAETALLLAEVEQASLIPGVLLPDPVRSRQLGAAMVSEVGPSDGRLLGGLDAGYASGDPAPGFGAFVSATGAAPRAGDLDGIQAIPRQRLARRQLPLPPRLPHRSHPLPPDHRHRHRRAAICARTCATPCSAFRRGSSGPTWPR